MSTSLGRPSGWFRVLTALPFVAAVAWLLVELFAPADAASGMALDGLLVGPVVLGAALLVSAGAFVRAHAATDPEMRRQRLDEAILVPSALAPLAILSPWVIAPSHLGVGYGSLPFFVSWLTRYPTVAGVDHEVLLGIGALLGASAVPAFAAFTAASGRAHRTRTVALLGVLQLVALTPVLVALDATTLEYAAFVAADGPVGIVGSSDASWWQNAVWGLATGAGALLRLAATASMLAFAARVLARGAQPRPVWETA